MASQLRSKFKTLPFLYRNKWSGRDYGVDAVGFSSKTATQVFGLYADTHHNRSSRIEGVVLAFLNPESKDNRIQQLMNNQEHEIAVERGRGGSAKQEQGSRNFPLIST